MSVQQQYILAFKPTEESVKLEVGQEWLMNSERYRHYIIHVLAIVVDKKGKYRVMIQEESTRISRGHFLPAKLVSPQWFFGMTIKIPEGK